MRFISRFYEMTRSLVLMRQAREVAKILQGLGRTEQRELAEMAQQEIARGAAAHRPATGDRPWGDLAEQALGRSRSNVPQLRNKGLATWLAVVFHETRESPQNSMQGVHREVLGFLGLLKGTYSGAARRSSAA